MGILREFLFFRVGLGVLGFFGLNLGDFVILSLLQKGEKSIRILKYALNLWILRCAQYDKDFVDMTKFISMTNKKFLWCAWGFGDFWGGILLNLSVVEFFGVWLGFFGNFCF